ncbi:MAG: formylglycine-generating enzyme family protein [Thermodesulfobacteriota bacterium]
MKNRVFFLTGLCLLTILSFSLSVKSSDAFEGGTGVEKYNLDNCGNCHKMPEVAKKGIEGMDTKECDSCHNPGEGLVAQLVVSDVSEEASGKTEETGPKDLREMVYIPAGKFIQGSNERHPDEGPTHEVYLDDYYIDKYEVTNIQYKEFVKATGHRKPLHWVTGTYPRRKAYHPVVYVDWFDANAYCKWAGKRLPNESEWEKAARGTDGRRFPWGSDFDVNKANSPFLKKGDTMPVGSFEEGRSPYGLYDVVGNVWEWTIDWYEPYSGAKDAETNIYYGKKNKVLRGGSWFDCSLYSCGMSPLTYNRSHFARDVRNNSFGFRCVKDAENKS